MTQGPASFLASHLINQIRSNLSLLEQLSVIQPQDADQIRTKLPPPNGPFPSLDAASGHGGMSSTGSIEQGLARLSVQPHSPAQPQTHQHQPPPPSVVVQSPHHQQTSPHQVMAPPTLPARLGTENRAKAIWDYTGNEADDLRFRAGDIIIIDEEVNSQWYRGRVVPQGEQFPRDFRGLFPSNYVEKIQNEPYNEKQSGGGLSMMPYQPPPPPAPINNSNNSYYNQPPPQHYQSGQAMVPHQQEEEKKHGKFGKIGQQLGNSAVNGAGFGFGAAAASNLVNRIF